MLYLYIFLLIYYRQLIYTKLKKSLFNIIVLVIVLILGYLVLGLDLEHYISLIPYNILLRVSFVCLSFVVVCL